MALQHAVEQPLRFVQWLHRLFGDRARLPRRQVMVEHGDRTGVEGDEQGETGDQAGPGVHRGERTQRSGSQLHLIAPSRARARSEEHTSELQSLMRISYAVFCLKK